jgi:hypothetical protein
MMDKVVGDMVVQSGLEPDPITQGHVQHIGSKRAAQQLQPPIVRDTRRADQSRP